MPILTHCEGGTGGLEQVEVLRTAGVGPAHVALSHVDKVVDRGYHRELCGTGATLEYDGAFRWGDAPNGTLQLLDWLAEDGLLDHVVLGQDAARRGYWATLGGSPGLAFLLGPFRDTLREHGFREDDLHRLFVANPARVFAFRDPRRDDDGRPPRAAARRPSSGRTPALAGSRSAVDAAARGELGPADIAEVLDDAVDLALRDQADAGIDVVTDGEMRRAGFFTAEFYRYLTGIEPLPADRRLGAGGHDQQHRFRVLEPIAAPNGLGVVAEFRAARARTDRPLKVTLPGPFTLSGRLTSGDGQTYRHRLDLAEAFVPILAAEIGGLVDAGATWIQVDEPSPAIHPEAASTFAELVNRALEPAIGRVRLGAHLCFGNYLGPAARPAAVSPGARRRPSRSGSTSSCWSSPIAR